MNPRIKKIDPISTKRICFIGEYDDTTNMEPIEKLLSEKGKAVFNHFVSFYII